MVRKRVLKPLVPAYAGKRSLNFWDRVNSIEGIRAYRRAYRMGCKIQDLESEVLKLINSQDFGENRIKQ